MIGSRFTLPEIYCPFPATTFDDRPHPAAADAAREIYALIDELDGETSLLRDAATEVCLDDFTGRLYPDATPLGLRLAMMFELLFFGHETWIDQWHDQGRHLSPLELNRIYDRALEVYDGASVAPSDTLVAHLLKHFRTMVHAFDRPDHSGRIRGALPGYLRAQVWEIDFQNHRKMPSLTEYQGMRRVASSGVLNIITFPLVFDLNVPIEVLDHPVIQQLQEMHANYISWVNDIMSLGKELQEDGALNLVFILQEERELTLQQAVDAAVEIVRREATAYLDLKARLPRLGVPLTGDLAELLDKLERWQADAIAYQQRAPRYSVAQ